MFFLFCVLKMHLKKFRHFSGTFLAIAIKVAADNILAKCWRILNGSRIESFIWGSGKLFFIGFQVQKQAGSSGGYGHLENLPYIIKIMTPAEKSNSSPMCTIFFSSLSPGSR
jgi:hypothetical protein